MVEEFGGKLAIVFGWLTAGSCVPIMGNTVVNSNRYFFVNLHNVTGGAQFGKTQGVGTILDDDPTTAATGTAQLRLYNNSTFEHLYTTDMNEYAVLATFGWRQEGAACTIYRDGGSIGASFAIPVYRPYHTGIFQHLWTTDPNEVTVLAANAWDYEGIAGYVSPVQESGTTPVYRLSLASPALHLWTTDANEKTVLSTQLGWVYEGVLGYVIP